jgi:hypothetical protein
MDVVQVCDVAALPHLQLVRIDQTLLASASAQRTTRALAQRYQLGEVVVLKPVDGVPSLSRSEDGRKWNTVGSYHDDAPARCVSLDVAVDWHC